MELKEIIRVNDKGEIKIPDKIRDQIGIIEGMHILLRADLDRREIIIVPFSTAEADLVEFKITLSDTAGALAKCATFLSENNINLVASESKSIQSGEIAEWIVVADISKCKANIRELCKELINEGYAKNSICRTFH
ncbi:MAG: hypothetical protein FK730_02375 [Asgard group archaeon]|nr:hypothetical protein [Asgard group archaeon]